MNSRDNKLKEYTQAELKTPDNLSICLVSIFGKVYNVTKFMTKHPGGEAALLNAGGDILDDVMQDGNHRNINTEKVLAPYQVGVLKK